MIGNIYILMKDSFLIPVYDKQQVSCFHSGAMKVVKNFLMPLTLSTVMPQSLSQNAHDSQNQYGTVWIGEGVFEGM